MGGRVKPHLRLNWRFTSGGDGRFDEFLLSVDRGESLVHAEMMGKRSIFVTVGDAKIWASVTDDGKVVVTGFEAPEGK